ncbi:OmpA family protein [Sphaerospermopsis kisseleviana CS-549]|uniref:OmpA family protein n=1 Tax=Sphaerospermopsis kisseleviana CS-549 TaxID=3021783 RepID=A0ABT4ZMY3_9CYAN|nr:MULTISPECIES: OmpA family protein [Sphaerospermopsis]MBC5797355.1 OmpA family protein [Sphaerospermopsis sp. LEGE 00249]MBD2147986.1 OmpA family protein [Sphaerospermopsis sp. FACHB-1194]MDB9440644.1 OmpA family protein [Sphaerospermopsis kisseleviana CS-549]BAZ80476.1 OmpA/MotB domain protein [Sphaerospermopsis kisseleviana NIES-73]
MFNHLNIFKNQDDQEEDPAIYLSIGDLMSSLLMFFALLFISALIQLNQAQKDITRILIGELEGQLKANNIEAKVDPNTGDISLRDSILFETNSAKLNPQGEKTLQKLIPIYSKVIFETPRVKDQIERVVIEGHTSAYGKADFNMELSLNRAWQVAKYTLYTMPFPNKTHKSQLEKKIMVVGRGENDAKIGDLPTDRRVVFRIQFKGQDLSKLNQADN